MDSAYKARHTITGSYIKIEETDVYAFIFTICPNASLVTDPKDIPDLKNVPWFYCNSRNSELAFKSNRIFMRPRSPKLDAEFKWFWGFRSQCAGFTKNKIYEITSIEKITIRYIFKDPITIIELTNEEIEKYLDTFNHSIREMYDETFVSSQLITSDT